MKVKQGKSSIPLSQSLGACIADFNKTTVQRKYKIDTCRRKVLTNLMRAPRGFSDLLAGHYDKHKHSSSGAIQFVHGVHIYYILILQPSPNQNS